MHMQHTTLGSSKRQTANKGRNRGRSGSQLTVFTSLQGTLRSQLTVLISTRQSGIDPIVGEWHLPSAGQEINSHKVIPCTHNVDPNPRSIGNSAIDGLWEVTMHINGEVSMRPSSAPYVVPFNMPLSQLNGLTSRGLDGHTDSFY
eukprot:Gb_05947 [translate_table: standard]